MQDDTQPAGLQDRPWCCWLHHPTRGKHRLSCSLRSSFKQMQLFSPQIPSYSWRLGGILCRRKGSQGLWDVNLEAVHWTCFSKTASRQQNPRREGGDRRGKHLCHTVDTKKQKRCQQSFS